MKFRSYYSITKILKCFRANWCRRRRKTFKIEKFVVLEFFEQQTDCNRYRRKTNKSRTSLSWRNQSYQTNNGDHYQTNGNHAIELSTIGHVILRIALGRYFRFHWNCKQLRVERSSMPNCEIYFLIFSETIHTNLKIFSQHCLTKCRWRLLLKKNRVLEFSAEIFV